MKIYKPHPAALVMPPMKADDLDDLKRSILERGQVHPAVTIDGMLLDGRNRQEAIRQLVAEKKLAPDAELKVVEWNRNGSSPAGFVDATNDKRRHLTESQRAMISTRLLPFFRKETKEKQAAAARATNRSKKKGQRALPLPAPGRKPTSAAKLAAKAAGGKVSARTVERAEFVRKADPAIAQKVFEGEMTVKQAERKIRMRGQVAKAKSYVLPKGTFAVIAADPPWEFDDELNGSMNRGLPYPTMTLEQICAMKVPAADDCALFLWTTKSHLLDGSAGKVVEAWGFKSKSMITWVKSNIGLGRYVRNRTEFVIIATRGSPPFDLEGDTSLKDDVIIQTGPRLKHSEKPAEFFARVEALCPTTEGGRLEMFARKPRAGWVTSGSELAPSTGSGDSARARPAMPKLEEAPQPPEAAPSFSQQGGSSTYQCADCGAEFVALEILTKHSKACPGVVSVLEVIASGRMPITNDDQHLECVAELKRLVDLQKTADRTDANGERLSNADGERAAHLSKAVLDYEAQRWPKPTIGFEVAKVFEQPAAPGPATVHKYERPLELELPPIDPASLRPPSDDEIPF